jgi:choline dehydrogenase
MDIFDYIIIGAGTAGCVLANRLSADGRTTVLVLEAGGSDRTLWIQLPIGYGRTYFDPRVNWMYETAPIAGLDGRTSYWPRGKVIGGSGSINAMVYVRGQPHDFDDWRAAGNVGWGWDDVLPYFKKTEDYELGADAFHGAGGPQHVTDLKRRAHPLCDAFIETAAKLGFPHCADFNAGAAEGVGVFQINTRNGRRSSTANALLRPALRRKTVELRTKAHVTQVLFDGRRATGVRYQHKGAAHDITARREIILSGGSINSPQLLQLSGVGDTALLQRLNISPIIDAPAVGQNLQDHLAISAIYKSTVPTLNDELLPWRGKVKAGLHYLFNRGGPLGLSVNQGGGFVRSDPAQPRINLQLYFSPVSYTQTPLSERKLLNPDPFSGFLLSFNACRPTSRGQIEIASADPMAPPRIQPNYLETQHDLDEAISGYRLLQKIAQTGQLASIIHDTVVPHLADQRDETLLADFRARADTVYHPTSSCMMGADPRASVVDARLRVHGVDGLRVIDASIFPTITSGNTNAPTVMVAEKGADMVIADAR